MSVCLPHALVLGSFTTTGVNIFFIFFLYIYFLFRRDDGPLAIRAPDGNIYIVHEEDEAKQVLSFLALLVQKYKY